MEANNKMNNSDKTGKLEKIMDSKYFPEFLKNNSGKTIVIKFGGSVLINESSYESLAEAVKQIKHSNINAYIVLSAKKGRTNELIKQNGGEELGELLKALDNSLIQKSKYNALEIAQNLLWGEIESVNALSELLKEKSVEHESIIQGSGAFPIIANGNYLNAEIRLKESRVKSKKLKSMKGIALIPGFGAENLNSEKVLLGRNSSDLIAAMIAKLDSRVSELIYVKDVCGVFENFDSCNQKFIERISAKELNEKNVRQVLDSRIFEWQRCRIRVTDLLNPGTLII